jgi:GT2 family glycosyltransferase
MYCEEVDWSYRLKQRGWQIFYTPDAEIVHHAGASTRQVAGPMLVQLHRSRDRFFRKHYGSAYATAARAIVRMGMIRAAHQTRCLAATGAIDASELARRLDVLRAVGT